MPKAVVPGDFLEVLVVATFQDQTAVAVLHGIVLGPLIGTPTAKTAAIALDATFAPLWKAVMSQNASYYGVGCRLMLKSPPQPIESNVGFPGPGQSLAPPMSPQSRGLVSWKTDQAGRSFRGRVYVPFPSTGAIGTTGLFVPAYLAELRNIGAFWANGSFTLSQGADTMGFQPAIFHRPRKNKPPLAWDNSCSPITGYKLSGGMATQRRSGVLGKANAPPF